MEQVREFGDHRNKGFCVHCGAGDETRDHVPSKVFLDPPYPENLPVSPACASCNEGFSLDEEYLACLLECVLAGSTDPEALARTRIAQLLRRSPGLRSRLDATRRESQGRVTWIAETDRVRNVLLKLARGHVAYEYNEPQLGPPAEVSFRPLQAMSPAERAAFEDLDAQGTGAWPEVGSRAMHRLLLVDREPFAGGWLDVQPGRYRHAVDQLGGLRVRMVLSEYLAAEVLWD